MKKQVSKFFRHLLLFQQDNQLLVKENIALAPLTTLKVGGTARFFVEAFTESEISSAVLFANEKELPLFILGGGSNVLISDEGFQGLVLKISLAGISVNNNQSEVLVTASAGEDWDQFVEFCVSENLQGIECLSGIPGTVGGTPVQNVGAYGQEVSETIVSVKVLRRETGEILEMSNSDCCFAYRSSILNTIEKDRYIVLSVAFRLKANGEPKIAYRDLQNVFADQRPSLKETRAAVLQIRSAKSMVLNQDDPNSQSAGSFFKNPLVTREKFSEIEQIAKQTGVKNVPSFAIDSQTVKIPAAWLIENAGFYKGYRLAHAGLSTKHTLAIVNLGEAKAEDILKLKNEIQRKVAEKFDIRLQAEPVMIGFD